ncbi:MAG: hypothetical protein ABJN57_01330 [Hyphomicrobiales bacterium]
MNDRETPNSNHMRLKSPLTPALLKHLKLTPKTTAEHLALEALITGTPIWLGPDLTNSHHYEYAAIRPKFYEQVLIPIFDKRNENQDIKALYEWTNKKGPFTPRELQLIEKTIRLATSVAFANQMRPELNQAHTHIRAEFLSDLVLIKQLTPNPEEEETPIKGIQISGATITGQLDLSNSRNCRPLTLNYCQFEKPLNLNHAQLSHLDLSGSLCPGLSCNGAVIHGETHLKNGFEAKGTVDFVNSKLYGTFNASGGSFLSSGIGIENNALSLQLSHINNSIILSDGFKSDGIVNLHGTQCDLNLYCRGAYMINQQQDQMGCALLCDNTTIKGNVDLGGKFSAIGGIWFRGTTIGGNIEAEQASFHNFAPAGQSDAILVQNSHINNTINLQHSNMIGRLTLQNSFIKGDVNGSYISINNKITNGTGKAVNINQCQIEGSVLFAECSIKGKNSIKDVTIKSTIDYSFSVLENISNDRVSSALNIENSTIGYNVQLAYGFSARGIVSAKHVKIGGNFICNGGHFYRNFDISDCQITGQLSLDNKNDPESKFDGQLTITNTSAHTLIDDYRSWPNELIQKNFTYEQFAEQSNTTASNRLLWLSRQGDFSYKAYSQAIKALTETGYQTEARTIAISQANQNYWQSLNQMAKQSNHLKRDRSPYMQKLVYFALWPIYALWWLVYGGWMVFGYSTSRILVSSLFMFLICASFYQKAEPQALLIPKSPAIALGELYNKCNPELGGSWTKCDIPELPSFSPTLYSVDNMVPMLNFEQQSNWRPLEKDFTLNIPTPSCYEFTSSCAQIKWLPVNLGNTFLSNVVIVQTTFGWAAIITLILNFALLRIRKSPV